MSPMKRGKMSRSDKRGGDPAQGGVNGVDGRGQNRKFVVAGNRGLYNNAKN